MGSRDESAPAPATVSVVISTKDRDVELRRCLDALLGGTRAPAEVIVVDQSADGGSDRIVAEAVELGLQARHLAQVPRGLSASQNAGFDAASFDVVAVIDDDCVPDPRWVETVDRAFRFADEPLLLTGRVLPLPVDGDRVAPVATRSSAQRANWIRPPSPWNVGTGGNFAVHRAAFHAVGGNDERLGSGSPGRAGNDLDLFDRLIGSGVRVEYEPDLLVLHQRSTLEEYRSRRSTYGFGVGAMIGLRMRRHELRALRLLAAWLRLRWATAYERRSEGGVRQEARVLGGTLAGLIYGLRSDVTDSRLRHGP